MSLETTSLLREALAQVTGDSHWLETCEVQLKIFFHGLSPLQAILAVRKHGLRPDDVTP